MEVTRRQFLTTASAASIPFTGGCSTISGDGEGDDLLQPGVIGYANFDEAPHTLDLVVSIQGEVKYWKTHDLASVERAESEHTNGTLDISLPSKPVEYTVIGRVDETETARTTSTTGIQWANQSNSVENPHCARVRVHITKSAELEVENWEAEQSYCTD